MHAKWAILADLLFIPFLFALCCRSSSRTGKTDVEKSGTVPAISRNGLGPVDVRRRQVGQGLEGENLPPRRTANLGRLRVEADTVHRQGMVVPFRPCPMICQERGTCPYGPAMACDTCGLPTWSSSSIIGGLFIVHAQVRLAHRPHSTRPLAPPSPAGHNFSRPCCRRVPWCRR